MLPPHGAGGPEVRGREWEGVGGAGGEGGEGRRKRLDRRREWEGQEGGGGGMEAGGRVWVTTSCSWRTRGKGEGVGETGGGKEAGRGARGSGRFKKRLDGREEWKQEGGCGRGRREGTE